MTPPTTKPRYGTTRMGGRDRAALPVALLTAVPLTALITLGIAWLYAHSTGEMLLAAAPSLMVGLPGFTALIWVVIVDRSTIPGVSLDTENSVESSWMREAHANAFLLSIAAVGLGAAVTGLLGHATVSITLTIVGMGMMLLAIGLYLIEKHR